MKSRYVLLILILLVVKVAISQEIDSLKISGIEVINKYTEHLEGLSEAGLDISELTDYLFNCLEDPLNINDANRHDLNSLRLLTDIQVKNIIDYRTKYGIFYSIYELKAIEGLSRNIIERIMPFVVVRPPRAPVLKESKNQLFHGRHELMFRYQRKLSNIAGYDIPPDSLQSAKTGSFYLGNIHPVSDG